MRTLSNRQRKRLALDASNFGKHLLWMPEDLPTGARNDWPPKSNWPTIAAVNRIVACSVERPDAYLAVLSGLRRWAEPASSQLLVALGSIIVSIVAIAVAVAASSFNQALYVSVAIVGIAYVLLALWGVVLAVRMDERRKMAFVWLRAIEGASSRRGKVRAKWFGKCESG
jgi:hypothetical protein